MLYFLGDFRLSWIGQVDLDLDWSRGWSQIWCGLGIVGKVTQLKFGSQVELGWNSQNYHMIPQLLISKENN